MNFYNYRKILVSNSIFYNPIQITNNYKSNTDRKNLSNCSNCSNENIITTTKNFKLTKLDKHFFKNNVITNILNNNFSNLALTNNGNIFFWEDISLTLINSSISQFSSTDIINQIYSNLQSYVITTTNGNVYISNNLSKSFFTPIKINDIFFDGYLNNIVNIHFNLRSYAALNLDKEVYVWGDPEYGGIDNSFATKICLNNNFDNNLNNIIEIYSNLKSYSVLNNNGEVFVWGDPNYGGINKFFATKLRVDDSNSGKYLSDIIKVYSTNYDYAGIDKNGYVYLWGKNYLDKNNKSCAFKIKLHNNYLSNIVKIHTTTKIFIAFDKNNNIYIWGDPLYGGISQLFASQVKINDKTNNYLSNIFKICNNLASCAVLNNNGEVFVWGNPRFGGINNNLASKLRIGNHTSGNYLNNITKIYNNDFAYAALNKNGEVYVWGQNLFGGIDNNFATKLRINNQNSGIYLTNIVQIFSTVCSFAAINNNGEVYIWGDKISGGINSHYATKLKFKNGSTTSYLSNIVHIYSNLSSFTAINDKNEIFIWGSNINEYVNENLAVKLV